MNPHLHATDEQFISGLEKSDQHVLKVAEWLRSAGQTVAVQPLRIRPDHDSIDDYSDDGDLVWLQHVEVKERGLDFTVESFPYDTIIVDRKSSFDKKRTKPYLYILTNRDCTCAAFVYVGKTRSFWLEEQKLNSLVGVDEWFYTCPIKLVQFKDMT